MSWMKWIKGRQNSGYLKLKLASWKFFDLYVLRYPQGSEIKPHNDIVPGKKHFRCNLVLKNAKEGGDFKSQNVIFKLGPLVIFRSDENVHSVSPIVKGSRWVLSLGWIRKKTERYNLFLDDERFPEDIEYPRSFNFLYSKNEWEIARTYEQAVAILKERGCPEFISFDHDLGTGQTGYDFAKWFVNMNLYNGFIIPSVFQYFVHSQNPIGKKNIQAYLNNYADKKREGDNWELT